MHEIIIPLTNIVFIPSTNEVLGGYIGFTLSVRLSVRLAAFFVPVCGHDFVHTCSKRWVHGFF